VGVVRGWAAEEYLRGTYPELEVVRSEDTRSGLRELSFGQLDAFVSDLPSATWALREEGLSNLRVGTESGLVYRMGIATRADWPVLHGLLCRALERMPKSEIDAIYERWVHPGAPPIGHSRRTVWILLGLAGSAALLAIAVLAWNRGLAREVGRRTAEVQHELAARQKAEERQRFMVRELDHRVKNTLATVLAVSDQTRRRSGSLDEFAVVFRGRISALSRVHEALSTNSWQGAGLRDVAERTLAPHTPGRVRLVGPDVVLPPASVQPLSMALHELTTNAVKYGALSNEVGVIELAWEELPDGRLRLAWTESGGPSVAHPENPGFGTKLVSAGITYELNGQVELSFAPEGVRCVITLP
jgi:two-component sensor histidine kinase